MKKNNIVLFPKLKERLHHQAMEALQNKDYKQALACFRELINLYGEAVERTAEVQVGIVVCLMEMGELTEAKRNCKRLLQADIGNYYDVLQIYLTICVQLHEYDEVVSTIEALLEENGLPPNQAEHLFQLLDFSRNMLEQGLPVNDGIEADSLEAATKLLKTENLHEQLTLLDQVAKGPIEPVLPQLQEVLLKDELSPFLKTMILKLLMEMEVNQFIKVRKFNKQTSVNPALLDDILEQDVTVRVMQVLDHELGNENPTLYDVVRQIWEHYLFIIFPFPLNPKNERVWAAALQVIGYDLHGITITTVEVCSRYQVLETETIEAIKQLQEIEQKYIY